MGCWQGPLEMGIMGCYQDCYRWDGTMGCWQELLEVGWYHGLLAGTVRGGMVPWAVVRDC